MAPSTEFFPEPEDGVTCLDSLPNGITVGRKPVIVPEKEEGQEFKDACLFRAETIDCPFLTRSYLVDAHFLGNPGPFATDESFRRLKIAFMVDPVVGIAEQRPGETTFQQPVRQERFPSCLIFQLREDTLHEKRKRGQILNQQNC